MRSMMLLCILDGVTGLVPWMYPFPWQQKIWDKFIARNMGNYPQNLWDKIKVAATSVKELTPYLITKENKNLTVKVVNTSKGTIRAKLYKNAKGKHALIIVGCSNGQFKGTIIVPNNLKLKSKHNLTTYLGNGKYQFVSKNLDSDVLFEY
jgi:hypothetical protein